MKRSFEQTKELPEKRPRVTSTSEDFFQQALTTINAIEKSPTSVSTRKQLKELLITAARLQEDEIVEDIIHLELEPSILADLNDGEIDELKQISNTVRNALYTLAPIHGIPQEVLQTYMLPHLSGRDISNLSKTSMAMKQTVQSTDTKTKFRVFEEKIKEFTNHQKRTSNDNGFIKFIFKTLDENRDNKIFQQLWNESKQRFHLLCWAVKTGYVDMTHKLLTEYNIDPNGLNWANCVRRALEGGYNDMVEYVFLNVLPVIEKNIDIDMEEFAKNIAYGITKIEDIYLITKYIVDVNVYEIADIAVEQAYIYDNVQLLKEIDAKIKKVYTYNLLREVFRRLFNVEFPKLIAAWLLEKYPQQLKKTLKLELNRELNRDDRRNPQTRNRKGREQRQVEKIQEKMMNIIQEYDDPEDKIAKLEFWIKMDQRGLLPQYLEPSFVQKMIKALDPIEYEVEDFLRKNYGSLLSDSDSDMSDSDSDSE